MRWLFALLFVCSAVYADTLIPRRVIGFWDSRHESNEDASSVRAFEMPLNYLGIDLEYHDIQKNLPQINNRNDVNGVIVSFHPLTRLENPLIFIQWLTEAIDHGKKIIIAMQSGLFANKKGVFTGIDALNLLFKKLGFVSSNTVAGYPFEYKITHEDKYYLAFEKQLPAVLPDFGLHINATDAHALLTLEIPDKPDSTSDLIILGKQGAYISPNFDIFDNMDVKFENLQDRGWYINPFHFLETIFNTDQAPVPDTTTLAGRRIFYSYVDGDSWNISTSIEKYKADTQPCSYVIMEEIVKPNPDLPMTQGIIAADLDPKWVGGEVGQKIARQFWSLPNVDPGSHTFSHPFEWAFFEHYTKEQEVSMLHLYPYGSWENSFLSWLRSKYYQKFKPGELSKIKLKTGYVIPRAYANEPFYLPKEIGGSISFLDQFSPRRVELLQWSGDCSPWSTPVKLCYEAHIKNIGGGDTRLDPEFPSILNVSPVGRKPGGWIQIFASSSAEVGYTYGWLSRFWGYELVQETWKNTETPRRLKPLCLYYHTYSGQFLESINALLNNIAYIRSQEYIPIRTSRFIDIALGFYSAELHKLGDARWKILNRYGLQTLRFDRAANRKVDLNHSIGVIGFRPYLDSLYIYLDSAVPEVIVQMAQQENLSAPNLVNSSWEIYRLKRQENGLNFLAKGWGKLAMHWTMPQNARYTVTATPLGKETRKIDVEVKEGTLLVELDLPYDVETEVQISKF